MATKAATSEARRSGSARSVRVVATNAAYGKLCQQSLKRLPARFKEHIDLHAFASLQDVTLPSTRAASTVFISRLADLPEEGGRRPPRPSGESKHLLFVESLPVEAMPARLVQLDIRNSHRLHLAAERSPKLIGDLIYRLLTGITHADGAHSIVDAWVEDEKLVLLSPTFDRLAVPLEELSKLIGSRLDEEIAFEIDEDGRFIFWPHADVHLGWEQFAQILDPVAALAAKQKSRVFNELYGRAIREFREEHGVKQTDVDGVTERHLRRVEHGEQAASKRTLEALANAHGMSLAAYLKNLAETMRQAPPKRSARTFPRKGLIAG